MGVNSIKRSHQQHIMEDEELSAKPPIHSPPPEKTCIPLRSKKQKKGGAVGLSVLSWAERPLGIRGGGDATPSRQEVHGRREPSAGPKRLRLGGEGRRLHRPKGPGV